MLTLTINYRVKWVSSRQIQRFQLYLISRSVSIIHRTTLLEYRLILKINDVSLHSIRFIIRICDTLKQVRAVYKFIPIKLNVIVVVTDLTRLFTFGFVQLGIIHIFFEQFSTRLRICNTAGARTLYEFFRKRTRLPILERNMSFSLHSLRFAIPTTLILLTRKHWSEYTIADLYFPLPNNLVVRSRRARKGREGLKKLSLDRCNVNRISAAVVVFEDS